MRALATGKKVKNFVDENNVRNMLVNLVGSDAVLDKKLKKATDDELRLLALVVCFSLETKGAIVISDAEELSTSNYNALVKLINGAKGRTIVCLTTSTRLVLDTIGADVYKF